MYRSYDYINSKYTSLSVRYPSYQSSTISVQATGTCTGVNSATAYSPSVIMKAPLAVNPTITGLDNNIYPGDASSATVQVTNPPSDITYSWALNVVNTSTGTITSAAIASPTSATTAINWPSGFVGDVDITGSASVCGTSRSTTKRVSVKYLPDWTWSPDSEPAVKCSGSSVTYRLQIFNGFTLVSATPHLNGAGNTDSIVGTMGSQSAAWNVHWNTDGYYWATFTVTDGSRNWNLTTANRTFDVAEFDPGQLNDIPLANYCAPATFNLTQAIVPSGSSYIYQYCNTGNCGTASPDWTSNTPTTSRSFSAVSTNTSFRMMLTETTCGYYYSNVVVAIVKPTPLLTVSDKIVFSNGTFDIPAANLPFSTVTVVANASGVSGASNATIQQGNVFSGVVATQTLSASAPADGTVTYTITPSINGCTGQSKNATVTVYKKPQVYSTRSAVYKGLSAVLSTDSYESYQWQTDGGQTLVTTPTYQTNIPGSYKIVVTKNGLVGSSDVFALGGQLTGMNENYIITRAPQKEITSIDGIEDKTENEVIESIQYFDGLGRPSQAVNTRMSPSHHDVVQALSYDQFGREAKKYLPYVSAGDNGRIQPNALTTDQSQFYQGQDSRIANDAFAFGETRFEPSPLNRVVEQGAPGASWQLGTGNTITKVYLTNGANEVYRLNYDNSTGMVTIATGNDAYYGARMLVCNKTIDEHGNDVLEYIDKEGRIVCKKVKAPGNTYACTYYVYDDLGNLVVVLPPEAVQNIPSTN